jgi:hypothetical protein
VAKHFSDLTSEAPDLVNFQLGFWRLAVEKYNSIQSKWTECAVDDGDENGDYTDNDFVIDAAVALVLAGTSVAEVIGQNLPAIGKETERLRIAYRKLINDPIPHDVESFFKIYDGLRHFGPAKHQAIEQLTEDGFCQHMTTAQAIWVDVLHRNGGTVESEFRRSFKFGDAEVGD